MNDERVEFKGVYLQQRKALYDVLKQDLLEGIVINAESLAVMKRVLLTKLSQHAMGDEFFKAVENFRDAFFSHDEKGISAFIAQLDNPAAKAKAIPAEHSERCTLLAIQMWKVVLCYQAKAIPSSRDYEKYLKNIIQLQTKHNLLEIHKLFHLFNKSVKYKELTIAGKMLIEESQVKRYHQLIFQYTIHIISDKKCISALNFNDTDTQWLKSFIDGIDEIIDEFTILSPVTFAVLFKQLIEEGSADGSAIIENESYPEQAQDRLFWPELVIFWPELELLINDPEASASFNRILVQGRDVLILAPQESEHLQKRVAAIIIDKMQTEQDRMAELIRLRKENERLTAMLLTKSEQKPVATSHEVEQLKAQLQAALAKHQSDAEMLAALQVQIAGLKRDNEASQTQIGQLEYHNEILREAESKNAIQLQPAVIPKTVSFPSPRVLPDEKAFKLLQTLRNFKTSPQTSREDIQVKAEVEGEAVTKKHKKDDGQPESNAVDYRFVPMKVKSAYQTARELMSLVK
ncbi:MAG: hypothetical protein M3R00_01050 [Pseudomonadota bacterium]|nr:hypothetical protein [Pseudomonadota bacterium]